MLGQILLVFLLVNFLLVALVGSIKFGFLVADYFAKDGFSTKHEVIYVFTVMNSAVVIVVIASIILYNIIQ